MNAKVKLRSKEVRVEIHQAMMDTIERAAFAVEGQVKQNIRNQPSAGHTGLIDTGFMVNSVYTIVDGGEDTYNQTDPSGAYKNTEGQLVERDIAPPVNPPSDGAVVAIGAEYAVYLEEDYQMLYKAAETVAKQMGGIVKQV